MLLIACTRAFLAVGDRPRRERQQIDDESQLVICLFTSSWNCLFTCIWRRNSDNKLKQKTSYNAEAQIQKSLAIQFSGQRMHQSQWDSQDYSSWHLLFLIILTVMIQRRHLLLMREMMLSFLKDSSVCVRNEVSNRFVLQTIPQWALGSCLQRCNVWLVYFVYF